MLFLKEGRERNRWAYWAFCISNGTAGVRVDEGIVAMVIAGISSVLSNQKFGRLGD